MDRILVEEILVAECFTNWNIFQWLQQRISELQSRWSCFKKYTTSKQWDMFCHEAALNLAGFPPLSEQQQRNTVLYQQTENTGTYFQGDTC